MASKKEMQDRRELAKMLFIHEQLSQKEISARVSVSEVTISKWAKDDSWDTLKRSMLITRQEQLNRLYMQLSELNGAIIQKPEGKRYADSKEADTIAKLAGAIKTMETEASIADVVEVSKRLLDWLRRYDNKKAGEVAAIFNDFIKDILKR